MHQRDTAFPGATRTQTACRNAMVVFVETTGVAEVAGIALAGQLASPANAKTGNANQIARGSSAEMTGVVASAACVGVTRKRV